MRVLAVDDDQVVLDTLRLALEEDEYEVSSCMSGEEGLSRMRENQYDFIILDVGLPGIDGFEVAAEARNAGVMTPIIMLTALGTEDDIVRGLEAGADDYLTKPFSAAELRARLRALGRRAASDQSTIRTQGGLRLDLQTRTVSSGEKEVRLTEKEFNLLWTLAEPPIKVWPREVLLERVWGMDFDPQTKVLDVHLTYLRRKLASIESSPIQTLYGQGWRLTE